MQTLINQNRHAFHISPVPVHRPAFRAIRETKRG